MLKTEMKSKTDKHMWEKKHRIRVTTKVDNRVHPLQWATILGPSPMGTDPINLFKMVQNGSGINFHNYKRNAVQSLQDLLSSGNYN